MTTDRSARDRNLEPSRWARSAMGRRVLALALGTLVGLVGLEAAVRLRQWLRIGSAGLSRYSTMVDPVSGLTIATPGQWSRRIVIDSLGFRGPEFEMPKPQGRIRLAFLGASTTFCAEVSGNEHTWPHLVSERLRREWPRASFDYVNAALPGYVIETNRRNLEVRVRPTQPDVIVFYEAVNDLSVDVRRLAERQGLAPDRAYEPHGLGRWSLTWWLIENNVRLFARRRVAAADQRSTVRFEPSELSRDYRDRLEQLLTEAKQIAPFVAVATFSQKVRREQTLEVQLHNANSYLFYLPQLSMEDVIRGFEEYNGVIRSVARAKAVLSIDGENTIPADDAHFIDSIHFTDAGSRAMADRVADALLADRSFRQLVEQRDPRFAAGQAAASTRP